jgi:DNA-binding MarR family transcriptional regulator
MAAETTTQTPPDPALDAGVLELASLFGRVFRNLKQRGGSAPQAFRDAFEEASLGPRHMPVMIAVTLEDGLSVSEVAERIGLSVATASLLVGELSRAGLVERTEDERDRRRTIVSLHGDHREVMEESIQRIVEPMRRALERLSPRARANFLEGWRILDEESAAGDPMAGDADCVD